jgi:hypothetical protein
MGFRLDCRANLMDGPDTTTGIPSDTISATAAEASPTIAIIDSQSVKSAEKDAMGQAARQL